MTGIGGIVFNILISDEPGICGSIPLGALIFSMQAEAMIY